MGFNEYSGVEQYIKKIIPYHRQRIKFKGTVKVLLEEVDRAYKVIEGMDDDFNLETAKGKQLDAIGEMVGANRMLNFEPLYAKPLLDDENYRKLIKACISLNQWDGMMEGLINLWGTIFSEYSIQIIDNQDMSLTLILGNGKDLFEQELVNKGYFAPKPMGVLINYYFIENFSSSGEIFEAEAVTTYFSDQELLDKKFQVVDSTGVIYSGSKQTSNYTFFELKEVK